MQNESGIMAAASMTDPKKMEEKFDHMLDEATSDYKGFIHMAFEDDIFKISALTNFKDLFDVCLDIKKKEKVEAAAVEESSNAAVIVAAAEGGEKPAKIQRRK